MISLKKFFFALFNLKINIVLNMLFVNLSNIKILFMNLKLC